MHTLDPQADGNVTSTTSTLPTGVTALTPYLFSNRDGLLVGDTVSVGGTEDPDRIIACGAEETLQWVEGAWDSVIADLEKQQEVTYGSDVPFEETKCEFVFIMFAFVCIAYIHILEDSHMKYNFAQLQSIHLISPLTSQAQPLSPLEVKREKSIR